MSGFRAKVAHGKGGKAFGKGGKKANVSIFCVDVLPFSIHLLWFCSHQCVLIFSEATRQGSQEKNEKSKVRLPVLIRRF